MGCSGVSQRLRGGGLSDAGGAEPAEPGAEPVAAAVPPGEVGRGVAVDPDSGCPLRAGVAEGPGAAPPHPISQRARANQILAIVGNSSLCQENLEQNGTFYRWGFAVVLP